MMLTYILIVEDDPDLRGLIASLLRRQYYGIHIDAVARITQGHNLLLHNSYDLAIVDGHLPDGEGAHLVECIHKAYMGPPMLGISGDPDALEELGMAGCGAVLGKPFTSEALYRAIESMGVIPEEDDTNPFSELNDADLALDDEQTSLRRVFTPEEEEGYAGT